MRNQQTDLFTDTPAGQEIAQRLTLEQAISLSVESLKFAEGFDTWLVGLSGGKDSSATVTLIQHLIDTGRINRPKNLLLIYNDTLMELPPLQVSVTNLIECLRQKNWRVFRTEPKLQYTNTHGNLASGRFFVNLLGVGYAPPSSKFAWCRQRMKLDPLMAVAKMVKAEYGDSLVTIDGVRLGESAIRDKAIGTSCRKDDGECGTTLIRDVEAGVNLSPIAHWRVCHVADWLVQADLEYSFPALPVLEIYGADIADGLEDLSARTGCFGCPHVTAAQPSAPKPDKAILRILKLPQWSHLEPLLELGDLYWQLHFDYSNRHLWDANTKGNAKRHGKPGALTLAARKWALERILEIEQRINREAVRLGRATLTIIRSEELALIQELQRSETFPERWQPTDPIGGDFLSPVVVNGQLNLDLYQMEETKLIAIDQEAA